MIIGNGSLAKILKDREGAIFFCSGVGNSQCTDYSKFHREIDLLRACLGDERSVFYFSSINPANHLKPYFIHKWDMEQRVKHWFENFNIIRLGNIWECTNPNTFLNYLRAHPEAEVREKEIKYMIHAYELNMICQSLPLTGKHEISIFSEMLTVKECLKR